MTTTDTHRPLCTIELIAEGRVTRCPGHVCRFWEKECAIARVEGELDGRPEVARLLLGIRRELERAKLVVDEDAVAHFHHRLSAGSE